MARTYYAEGRQITNALRVLVVLIAFILYFFKVRWEVFLGFVIVGIIFSEVCGVVWTLSRRAGKNKRRATGAKKRSAAVRRSSLDRRSDEVILSSRLDELSGPEFERLLALYFRDIGYTVKEVGVGGNDGGVDLVIIDRRGEKTAVQAKCYADHNAVSVHTVRELVAAKRNHDCILSLLVTTSDLTAPAKREAEQFRVDYWHGALLEQKLTAWGKWNPGKKRKVHTSKAKSSKSNAGRNITVHRSTVTCRCGSEMVIRKNRQGQEFYGCSTFPKCRHTRSV